MSDDVSGRHRLTTNALAVWAGQAVVIATGFIMPRLIDETLSRAELGIWDFGWATVLYFRLMGLGMAAGLNRYVALYSAQQRDADLVRAVSSTSFLQLIVTSLTLIAAFGFGLIAHLIFDADGAALADSSRWLITLLGTGVAIRMYCWTARGILTGYHLWSHTATVTAFGDILLLVFMVAALSFGGGLITLGACYLTTTMLTESTRMFLARRIYGRRFLQWHAVDRAMIRKLLIFGVKTNIVSLPLIVVMTTVNMVLAAASGPAALAVYARPLSLTRHAQTLVSKFANMLTSTSASLQGLGRQDELQEFFLTSTRAAFAMTLPLLLLVGIHGDTMVRIWMGEDYVDPLLSPLICTGMLLPYASASATRVLIGLNYHGKAAIAALLAAGILLGVGITVGYVVGWSPRVAAIISGTSLSASLGVVIPIIACRRLGVPIRTYVTSVFRLPVLLNVPFAAVLIAPKAYSSAPSISAVISAIAAAGCLLAALYWSYLFTPAMRASILARLGKLRRSDRKAT